MSQSTVTQTNVDEDEMEDVVDGEENVEDEEEVRDDDDKEEEEEDVEEDVLDENEEKEGVSVVGNVKKIISIL
jgi:hypothetical protein